jgi:hypothetical protein
VRRVAERRVVRHLPQPEGAAHLAPFGEADRQAPVVEPQLLLEHEEREQLRLGEVVAGARTGVARQRALPGRQRLARQGHHGRGHRTHQSSPHRSARSGCIDRANAAAAFNRADDMRNRAALVLLRRVPPVDPYDALPQAGFDISFEAAREVIQLAAGMRQDALVFSHMSNVVDAATSERYSDNFKRSQRGAKRSAGCRSACERW